MQPVNQTSFRRSLDHGSNDSSAPNASNPSDPGTPSATTSEKSIVITCLTDLADVCHTAATTLGNVTVDVRSYRETLDAARAGSPPAIWVTVAPLDRLAVDSRSTKLYPDAPVVLASSPIALVTFADRADILATACQGTITWKCVGEHAGSLWSSIGGQPAWQKVTVGHANPRSSAFGMLTLGAAAVGYFNGNSFIKADIENDPGFPGWFNQLEGPILTTLYGLRSPLDGMTLRKIVNVVGTPEVDLQSAGTQLPLLSVSYPEPAVRVDAEVAALAGTTVPAALVSELTAALIAAGWKAAGVPNGLPSAEALLTLANL